MDTKSGEHVPTARIRSEHRKHADRFDTSADLQQNWFPSASGVVTHASQGATLVCTDVWVWWQKSRVLATVMYRGDKYTSTDTVSAIAFTYFHYTGSSHTKYKVGLLAIIFNMFYTYSICPISDRSTEDRALDRGLSVEADEGDFDRQQWATFDFSQRQQIESDEIFRSESSVSPLETSACVCKVVSWCFYYMYKQIML